MYDFYFDSGTTNTRAYLLEGTRIAKSMSVQIGSRDSALQGDNSVLVRELRRIYDEVLARHCLTDAQVRNIFMSGMISCPSGLVEIEHLSTPVSRQTLAESMVPYDETQFFRRRIFIVPGIKTLPQGQSATLEDVEAVNNMRGEETEIIGILHRCPALQRGRAIVVLPGSHTQVAFLRDGAVENISSNITGELYNAIISETILSSSLIEERKDKLVPTGAMESREIDPAMVQKGYETLHRHGFNRALYIVRTMLLFTDASLCQRRSYLEGVLNGGVMDAIAACSDGTPALLAVAGPRAQYEVFTALAATCFPQLNVLEVPSQKEMPFSVEGLLSLIASW